jgi:hypothetical protein
MVEKRICSKCGIEKELCDENFYFRKNRQQFQTHCRDCVRNETKIYKTEHKEQLDAWRKQWRPGYEEENADRLIEYRRQYYIENREDQIAYSTQYAKDHREQVLQYKKEYRLDNIEQVSEYAKTYNTEHQEEKAKYNKKYKQEHREEINAYDRERRNTDPMFRLRNIISSVIWQGLNRGGNKKNGESCTKYLSYTFEELKQHLESLFEPWMNWNNQGKYNSKTWDDDNCSTWTWQIDHIIPQADLPYKTMEDDNFKKCWALDNLRPLSSKQNLLDGVQRTRHKKDK